MRVKRVSMTDSSLNMVHLFKRFQPFFIAVGLQKISLEGSNIKPLSVRAKIFQFVFLGLLISMYCFSILNNFEEGEEYDTAMSRSNHILIVNTLLIIASSIYSSAIRNDSIYFKLVRNTHYVDEKLTIRSPWYINTKFKLSIAFLLFVIYYGIIVLWDYCVRKKPKNLPLYLIYVLLLSSDLIIFQYLFDVWIVASRLKTLTSQLIDLVQPILLPGIGNIIIDMDYLKKHQIFRQALNEKSNVECISQERFEGGIVRLMSVFDKLADNVGIINSAYGVQLVLITICCLTVLLTVWNYVILCALGLLEYSMLTVVGFINWSFHNIVILGSYLVMGEHLNSVNRRIIVTINKFQMYNFIDKSGRKRLSALEHHINSRSMGLTAWRLFAIDASLIVALVESIATYTVIIYQMNSTYVKSTR